MYTDAEDDLKKGDPFIHIYCSWNPHIMEYVLHQIGPARISLRLGWWWVGGENPVNVGRRRIPPPAKAHRIGLFLWRRVNTGFSSVPYFIIWLVRLLTLFRLCRLCRTFGTLDAVAVALLLDITRFCRAAVPWYQINISIRLTAWCNAHQGSNSFHHVDVVTLQSICVCWSTVFHACISPFKVMHISVVSKF